MSKRAVLNEKLMSPVDFTFHNTLDVDLFTAKMEGDLEKMKIAIFCVSK